MRIFRARAVPVSTQVAETWSESARSHDVSDAEYAHTRTGKLKTLSEEPVPRSKNTPDCDFERSKC